MSIASPQQVDDVKERAAAELTSLEDLYADTPSGTPKERAAPAEVQPADEPADEVQTPEPKADKAKARVSDDEDDQLPDNVHGLKSAVTATRAKAREYRERAKDLEQRLEAEARQRAAIEAEARRLWERQRDLERGQQPGAQAPQQRQPNPSDEMPDPVLNPVGHRQWVEKWTQGLVDEKLAKEREAIDQHLFETKFNLNRERLLEKVADKEDFLKAEHEFKAAADQDPNLWKALRSHPYPAEFAYQTVRNLRQIAEMREAGGIDAYIHNQVQRKLDEAMKARPQDAPQVPQVPTRRPPTPPPQSLARTPSVAPRSSGRTYEGPTPLTDLYES